MWYKQKAPLQSKNMIYALSCVLSGSLLLSNTHTTLFCLVDLPSVKQPIQSVSLQVTSFLNLYVTEKEFCELFRIGITNPIKQYFIAFTQFKYYLLVLYN